ncbi:MAG: hypothetical protein GF370_04625 [Candidatus Nealsonbacteria bacterium]|nr:hypothetical protein [Candidatus Nealsonbacteria bacterium]
MGNQTIRIKPKLKKTGFLIFLLAVLGGVFFSSPAQAFVFDLATMQLDALDFADKLLNFLYNIVLVLVSSIVLLNLAAGVLDVVLAIPIQIAGNSLVTEGWTFMVGLSNTFIVLAILAIAIAYILRIESFQAKKMLPKLIMVALLINFSLVLVSGLVDIASFFHNTVLQALSVNSIQTAIQPIIDQMIAFIPWYLGILIGYQVAALIPYANVVALVVVVILLMYDFLAGSFVQFLIMALISASFVSVLGFLIFLFLARIVMIWILAIFAPIAIVTSVLPPLKRVTGKISFLNFEGWFQSLLEWLFLGEIILFLLALGLRFISAIESALGGAPANIPINTGVGIYNFPGGLINYFFLLVYIILVSHFAKNAAPELAGMIQGQITQGVKNFRGQFRGGAALSRRRRERAWEKSEKISSGMRAAPLDSARAEKWAKSEGRFVGAIKRGLGRRAIRRQEEEKEERSSIVSGFKSEVHEQYKDPDTLFKSVTSELKGAHIDAKKVAIADELLDGNNFKKLNPEVQKELFKLSGDWDKNVQEKMARANLNLITPPKEGEENPYFVQEVYNRYKKEIEKKAGRKEGSPTRTQEEINERVVDSISREENWENLDQEEKSKKMKEFRNSAIADLIVAERARKVSASDLEGYKTSDLINNERLLKEFLRQKDGNFLGKMAEHHGQEIMNKTIELANGMTEELAEKNTRALDYLFANRTAWGGIEGIEEKEDIQRLKMKVKGPTALTEEIKQKHSKLAKLEKVVEDEGIRELEEGMRDYYEKLREKEKKNELTDEGEIKDLEKIKKEIREQGQKSLTRSQKDKYKSLPREIDKLQESLDTVLEKTEEELAAKIDLLANEIKTDDALSSSYGAEIGIKIKEKLGAVKIDIGGETFAGIDMEAPAKNRIISEIKKVKDTNLEKEKQESYLKQKIKEEIIRQEEETIKEIKKEEESS